MRQDYHQFLELSQFVKRVSCDGEARGRRDPAEICASTFVYCLLAWQSRYSGQKGWPMRDQVFGDSFWHLTAPLHFPKLVCQSNWSWPSKTNYNDEYIVAQETLWMVETDKVSPRKYVYFFYYGSYSKCIQIFWDSLYISLKSPVKCASEKVHKHINNWRSWQKI